MSATVTQMADDNTRGSAGGGGASVGVADSDQPVIASGQPKTARWLWIAAAALFVLHQDFWLWSDRTLVLGFMPIGLLYHAGFSVAAGLLWLGMVKFAWPAALEAWADEDHSYEEEDVRGGPVKGAAA